MKILSLTQGTPDWHTHRAKARNASEASALMGASPYKSRGQLLREKATGLEPEYDNATLARFADGHRVEELARPIAEQIIGDELYPATATGDDGYLSASFDGVTMDETVIWECKLANQQKIADVQALEVPDADYWQVVQQLDVSGAKRCLYMVTDGTEDGSHWLWVYPEQDDMEKLRAAWKQFDADLADQAQQEQPSAASGPAVIGKTPDNLPALRIEVTGAVTASNLNDWMDHAMSVLQGLPAEPETDQEFADAERVVKWLKNDVEDRLKAAKDAALQQTADIYELFQAIDQIADESRQRRLALEKRVKARKQEIREQILVEAKRAWANHLEQLNAGLGKLRVPEVPVDFAGAMKGKRTITSLRDAVDDELARAKIEAGGICDRMRAGLEILREEAAGYETLFADAQALVQKDPDDLRAVIKTRIAEHKAAEDRRIQAEAERKARAEAEARAKAEAEARTKAEDEKNKRRRDAIDALPTQEAEARLHDEPAKQKTAAELYESAKQMRTAAQYAETSDVMRKEMADAADVEAMAREAEAREQAEAKQPQETVVVPAAGAQTTIDAAKIETPDLYLHGSLLEALTSWQRKHGVANDAMEELMDILSNHELRAAA